MRDDTLLPRIGICEVGYELCMLRAHMPGDDIKELSFYAVQEEMP